MEERGNSHGGADVDKEKKRKRNLRVEELTENRDICHADGKRQTDLILKIILMNKYDNSLMLQYLITTLSLR